MLHHWHLIFSHDCIVPRGTLSGNHLFIKARQLDTLWWQCAELNMFLLFKSYLLPRAVENWKKGVVVKSSYFHDYTKFPICKTHDNIVHVLNL